MYNDFEGKIMNLNDIFNSLLSKSGSDSSPSVLVPANDLLKLQKGYIEHLESKLNAPSPEVVSGISKILEKHNRDALMKLADSLKLARETDDKEALLHIENEIRKKAFGPPDSEGI